MSQHARYRRRGRHRGGARWLIWGGGLSLAVVVLAVAGVVVYVLHVASTAPALSSLRPLVAGGSSQVFAANGTSLGYIQSDELRSPVDSSVIPARLKQATVAIEDQRFYKNDGIDLTAIFRALIKDVTNGKAVQGASTITMQLMRNLYLGGDDHSLHQKIIEAQLALTYTEHHSKSSILTSYLNSVPYGTIGGQTAIGVQAASRVFFDKSVSQLDLEQSALLAGLPQAPSEYNPLLNPTAAKERRNEVLAKMAQLHYISPALAARTQSEGLQVHRGHLYSERKENFFFEYVRQQLVERYGSRTVEKGGLKVYTTIDLNMQRLARNAITQILNEPEDPAAAIVTLNPHNGDIEAMAESESYEQSQYNLAADGHRQPGSTFKAIDLADALSRGIDPNSTSYFSHTLQKGWLTSEPNYEVKTFEGTSLNKWLNLVQATVTSDNTIYAQLADDLGEESITHTAYNMGVKEHLEGNPAQALGGLKVGVTPLEMSVVFATLADGGYRNTPIAITKVAFPDGHVDTNWGQPHRVKVLTEAVTAEETTILEDNVHYGTAGRSAITCPTAAKTGTTSELFDAWLDGYTPNYATVVWMGYPKKNISMTDVHGEPQQGGYLPAEIWHAYMAAVTEGQTCVPFKASKEALVYKPFVSKFSRGNFLYPGELAGPGQPGNGALAPEKTPLPRLKKAPAPGAEAPATEAPATTPTEAPATGTPGEVPTHAPPTSQEAGGAPAG